MEIQKIITELVDKKILRSEPQKIEKLSGGTISELYLLHIDDSKYVLKFNDPKVTASEALFLGYYQAIQLVPHLLFVEPSNRFIVYSYIPGSPHYLRGKKREILESLSQKLLSNYKIVGGNTGWGWMDEPTHSWKEFLCKEITEANEIIGSRLAMEDHDFAFSLAQQAETPSQPFLLHGDCGMHNFIFSDQELCGVIDPMPLIGDPFYDLIDAFCSSPDDLTRETLDAATNYLTGEKEQEKPALYEKVAVSLYLRIGTCIKHHPGDLADYVKAWAYWKKIIQGARV